MTFLISEDVNLLRWIFLVGKVSKFFAVACDSPPFPDFPIKIKGDIWLKFWEIILPNTVLY